MIDIHNHLLPGLDDGVKNIETTIDLLLKAEEVGITHMCFTPHYSTRRFSKLTDDIVCDTFEEVKRIARTLKLNIELYLSRECDYEDDIKLKYINGNYVLLDFFNYEGDIEEVCYKLKIKGITPIIAHPERYKHISLDKIIKCKEFGALLQVNAKSIVRKSDFSVYTKVRKLIKNNHIDLIASDHHGKTSDWEHFIKAKKYIRKLSEDMFIELFSRNQSIVLGIQDEN